MVIIRFPLIPGYTDTPDNIEQVKSFIAKQAHKINRIDVLPFHNLAKDKYSKFCKPDTFSNISRPDEKSINKIRTEFESLGLQVHIGG